MNSLAVGALEGHPLIEADRPKKMDNGAVLPKCTEGMENVEVLPPLKACPKGRQAEFAVKKMQFCTAIEPQSVHLKRAYLEELRDHLTSAKGAICERIYGDLFAMFAANIFRLPLPPGQIEDQLDETDAFSETFPEEGENQQNGGDETTNNLGKRQNANEKWRCEFQPVHEMFAHVLESPDFKVTLARNHLDQQFAVQLIRMLCSPIGQERQLLTRTLRQSAFLIEQIHSARIYAKFVRLRPFMRRQLQSAIEEFLFDPRAEFTANAVEALLNLLEEVVDGFKVPLKREDREMFHRVLLPLHKSAELEHFHSALVARVLQFIGLGNQLADPAVRRLLKIWPKLDCAKESLFLSELEQIVQRMDLQQFKAIANSLFAQVAQCLCSQHAQVASHSLHFWKNERIVALMRANSAQTIPIVFGPLDFAANSHWNIKIRALAKEVQNLLMQLNWTVYNRIAAQNASQK